MAQVLKDETRRKILEAALTVFSEKGYEKSGLAEIAGAAGISVGTIYCYFQDKKSLFRAVLPRELAASLRAALRKKIGSWNGIPLTDPARAPEAETEELLRLMIARRRELKIIFLHPSGTGLEDLGEEAADYAYSLFSRYLKSIRRGVLMKSPAFRAALRGLYGNLVRTLVPIVSEAGDERAIPETLRICLAYHMAGIRQLLSQ